MDITQLSSPGIAVLGRDSYFSHFDFHIAAGIRLKPAFIITTAAGVFIYFYFFK